MENSESTKYHYCKIFQDESDSTKMMFLNRAMLFPPEPLKEKLQQKFKDYEEKYNPILNKIIQEGLRNGLIRDISIDDVFSFFYCVIDGLFIESCYYSKDEYNRRFNSIWSLFWKAIKA